MNELDFQIGLPNFDFFLIFYMPAQKFNYFTKKQ